ncbi:MAG: hypothetical protein IT302_07355 [Dehalococcoidia bacterium]|nr:hypothetical protein [Dehalococcoidia bacterium]
MGAALLVVAFALGDPATARPASAAAPVGTSEVTQSPAAGSLIAPNTIVTYTVNVTLSVAQSQSLTIQLAAGGIGTSPRTLTCTSSTNGNADVVGSGGSPSCKWNGPVTAGTFTFVFTGPAWDNISDAVPNGSSVFCTDTNNSNTCGDEAAGDKTPLADSNGDVGPAFVTATVTPTVTNTATATNTVPPTATGTATSTSTATPTPTATGTSTMTPSATPTGTPATKPAFRAFAPFLARDEGQ